MKIIFKILFLSFLSFLFISCGGSSSSSNLNSYKITIKNLTTKQDFSPITVIIQKTSNSYEPFVLGQSASPGLEMLAEAGDGSELIKEAREANVLFTNIYTNGVKVGKPEVFSFAVDEDESLKLSLFSMLTKTNDAFIAIKDIKLYGLTYKKLYLNVYDAGTEENTETSATIPHSDLGGEIAGFNASRINDIDKVTLHRGILASELSTSDLMIEDKWQNPAAVIIIEKI